MIRIEVVKNYKNSRLRRLLKMTIIEEAALKFFRNKFPASKVHICDLKNYLKYKGWLEIPFKRMEVIKFRSPKNNSKYFEVFVPSREDFIDYERAIEIVIEVLSSFENRNFEDIFTDIVNINKI